MSDAELAVTASSRQPRDLRHELAADASQFGFFQADRKSVV